ncbi:MAG: dUTP diphosphatase [Desulfobulbaceae bacterium]|nr:dUTP diphosphatase [Desulfobulbaceae bacterium]
MKEKKIQFKWLIPPVEQNLNLPHYETSGASGMDVEAAVVDTVSLFPGEIVLLPTGFAVALPTGYELQVRPRSGLAVKRGITLVNSPGTIDADYRGEVRIALINHGKKVFDINRGDRIAQLVLSPVVRACLDVVEELDITERGSGGFGHTGV